MSTDASIEMQQFEQKRFQDVALTHTHEIFLLKDCFPLAERDASGERPDTQNTRVSPRRSPAASTSPRRGCFIGHPTAARTSHPLRPLWPQRTCRTRPAVEDPPAPPFLRRPPEGRCGGEGEVVLEPGEEELDGHPAATRLPPNKICCGRGGNTALLFPSNNA